MDMEKLAGDAAVAAVKELTTTGIKAGTAGAGQLWEWIRGKVPVDDAAIIAAIESQPSKSSTEGKVGGVLKDLLDGRPDLQVQLTALLAQSAEGHSVEQTATAADESKSRRWREITTKPASAYRCDARRSSTYQRTPVMPHQGPQLRLQLEPLCGNIRGNL